MAKKSSSQDRVSSQVSDFCGLHSRLSEYDHRWIFRGHANVKWKLVPKAGRKSYIGHERNLFESWKLGAAEHHSSHVDSEWEWLAIAQHHGLATRLLDWTINPLNAAYFAVREDYRGPAVIHAAKFNATSRTPAETSVREPLKFDSVGIFRPRGVVPRIVRQGGLFTVHGPPETSLESLAQRGIVILERIEIAESYRKTLLAELARYGINSASLFPGLDGLSTYLNWAVESGEILD
jgi:FRG domain